MELSSAVCTVFCFACSSPSSIASGSFASAYFIGRYPPPSRFALSVSLGSVSAACFRLLLFGLDGANIVHCDYGSYLFRIAPGVAMVSLPSTCLCVSGLSLLFLKTSTMVGWLPSETKLLYSCG